MCKVSNVNQLYNISIFNWFYDSSHIMRASIRPKERHAIMLKLSNQSVLCMYFLIHANLFIFIPYVYDTYENYRVPFLTLLSM